MELQPLPKNKNKKQQKPLAWLLTSRSPYRSKSTKNKCLRLGFPLKKHKHTPTLMELSAGIFPSESHLAADSLTHSSTLTASSQ